MIYLQLLLSYLKIGFFGFGGGYAMISLIQNEVVVRNNWLTSVELADIVAVSQMTPVRLPSTAPLMWVSPLQGTFGDHFWLHLQCVCRL